MKTQITQGQYNLTERHGQLAITLNNEIIIPENDPVRLLSAQLEELEYGKLYEAYSSIGRKWAADPKVMFEVLVHGYLCGTYSSRQLEEACRKRVDFMWLLGDERVPDHSTLSRFRKRFAPEIEDLFYQYARYLEGLGETDHGTVFIDGTKLESRAGNWPGSARDPSSNPRKSVLPRWSCWRSSKVVLDRNPVPTLTRVSFF